MNEEYREIFAKSILDELINLRKELTEKEISKLGLILNCIKSRGNSERRTK